MSTSTSSSTSSTKQPASKPSPQAFHYCYLHGFASSPTSHRQVPALTAWAQQKHGVQIHAPSLNVPTFRDFTVSNAVAHVKELMQRQTGANPTEARWRIVSTSLGSLVATLVAEQVPEQIDSLLLINPAVDSGGTLLAQLGNVLTLWKQQGALPMVNPENGRMDMMNYKFIEDLIAQKSYPLVKCPVTIIAGKHDVIIPPTVAAHYATVLRAHRQSELKEMLEDADKNVKLLSVDDGHGMQNPESMMFVQQVLEDMWLHQRSNDSSHQQQERAESKSSISSSHATIN